MTEDDFQRWEDEFSQDAEEQTSDGRALAMVTVATAAGCVLLIVMGNIAMGSAGLVLASLIFLLWRVGM